MAGANALVYGTGVISLTVPIADARANCLFVHGQLIMKVKYCRTVFICEEMTFSKKRTTVQKGSQVGILKNLNFAAFVGLNEGMGIENWRGSF